MHRYNSILPVDNGSTMKMMNCAKHLALALLLPLEMMAVNFTRAAEPVPAPPQLNAKAWLLMDAASGTVLLENNA
ncbi:MAG: hypothetical protein IT470_07845, partial [Pseudomonadales bacterium]|nr:hypothetical protein [Pseudomonadales bacterium]